MGTLKAKLINKIASIAIYAKGTRTINPKYVRGEYIGKTN